MKKPIYLLDELIEKTGVSKLNLNEWERMKLIVPTGFTDDKTPCYSNESVEQVRHIQKLLELGYALEEILKIIQKEILMKKTEG